MDYITEIENGVHMLNTADGQCYTVLSGIHNCLYNDGHFNLGRFCAMLMFTKKLREHCTRQGHRHCKHIYFVQQ